jgi:hypothetical protein
VSGEPAAGQANKEALEAASARFPLPPPPAELTVTYRGPFGPLKIEVDVSGYARCFQTARRAPDAAGDSASSCACTRNTTLSFGPVARCQASVPWSRRGSGSKRTWKRWQRRLVLTLDVSRAVSGMANAALRAAALLAVKLGAFYEHKEAPAVLEALLKVAGAA